jgi:hypothetical protein
MKVSKILPLLFLMFALVITACNNNEQDQNNNEQTNTEENNNGNAEQDGTNDEETGDSATENQENNTETEDNVPKEGTANPENAVFKVSNPQLGAHVGTSFTVEGQAQAFEGQFSYRIEDEKGNELTTNNVKVEAGEEDNETLWRDFNFQVDLKNSNAEEGNLILFTKSQKDDSVENELIIPLTFIESE